MKHWTEYDPNTGVRTGITFGVNPKLWHYIEQTRGNKSRAKYIREILTKIMECTEQENKERDGKEWQRK